MLNRLPGQSTMAAPSPIKIRYKTEQFASEVWSADDPAASDDVYWGPAETPEVPNTDGLWFHHEATPHAMRYVHNSFYLTWGLPRGSPSAPPIEFPPDEIRVREEQTMRRRPADAPHIFIGGGDRYIDRDRYINGYLVDSTAPTPDVFYIAFAFADGYTDVYRYRAAGADPTLLATLDSDEEEFALRPLVRIGQPRAVHKAQDGSENVIDCIVDMFGDLGVTYRNVHTYIRQESLINRLSYDYAFGAIKGRPVACLYSGQDPTSLKVYAIDGVNTSWQIMLRPPPVRSVRVGSLVVTDKGLFLCWHLRPRSDPPIPTQSFFVNLDLSTRKVMTHRTTTSSLQVASAVYCTDGRIIMLGWNSLRKDPVLELLRLRQQDGVRPRGHDMAVADALTEAWLVDRKRPDLFGEDADPGDAGLGRLTHSLFERLRRYVLPVYDWRPMTIVSGAEPEPEPGPVPVVRGERKARGAGRDPALLDRSGAPPPPSEPLGAQVTLYELPDGQSQVQIPAHLLQ